MYIADLVSMRNIEKTEMTRLKLVVLARSVGLITMSRVNTNDGYEQLTPYFGSCIWSVIGSGVDGGVGTRVEAVCSTISPKLGAIKIWSSDSKQSEESDCQRKFESKESPEGPFVRTVSL